MATTEIERLLVRLVGDATSYQKMLKDAEASSKRAAGVVEAAGLRMQAIAVRLKAVGASMSRLGRGLALRVTAPLAIIGGLSVRAFSQFDQAMIESTSIMKTTGDEVERMRDLAISLSGRSAQAPKELAESYFFLASAGKNAEQSMMLLPKVAKFATAGAFDMALATDLLTDAQSALGLTSKDVAKDTENLVRVSDVLVKANTLANASVQQFSVALTSKAGAALKSYNIQVEEGVAVLAALADQGIKAQLAGNALDRVIRLLSKASRDNTKEFKELGFSVFETDGSMRNLADIIGNIENITRDMSVEMKSATLEMLGFEARVQGVILPLLGTSKAIRKYEADLKKAKGITNEVANKQMKSFSNQMKLLKNRITAIGIEIGKILAPILEKLSELLQRGADFWKGLSAEVKKTIVIIGLIVAAVGPLLITMGGLVGILGFAASGIAALIGIVGALLSPVVLATAAIVAFGAWVLWMSGITKTATEFLKDSFKKVFDGMGKALKAGELKLAMKIMWEGLKEVWFGGLASINEAMGGWLTKIVQGFLDSFKAIAKGWFGLQEFIAKKIVTHKTTSIEKELARVNKILKTGSIEGPFGGPAFGVAEISPEARARFQKQKTQLKGQLADAKAISRDAVKILEEEFDKKFEAVDAFFAQTKALNSKELRDREAAAKAAKAVLKKELDDRILAAQKAANAAAAKVAGLDGKPKLPVVPTVDPGDMPKLPTITAPVRFEVVTGVGVGSAEDLARIAEFQAGAGMRMASRAAPKIAKSIVDDPFRNVPIPGVPDIPLLPPLIPFHRKLPDRPNVAMPTLSSEDMEHSQSIITLLMEIRDDARGKPGFDEVAEAAGLN